MPRGRKNAVSPAASKIALPRPMSGSPKRSRRSHVHSAATITTPVAPSRSRERMDRSEEKDSVGDRIEALIRELEAMRSEVAALERQSSQLESIRAALKR